VYTTRWTITGPCTRWTAATGATLHTFDQTATLEEVIYSDGVCCCHVNRTPEWAEWQDYTRRDRLKTPNDYWNNNPRIIMAIDAATGTTSGSSKGSVYPGSFAADATGFVYHDGTYLYKLDRRNWQPTLAFLDHGACFDPLVYAFGHFHVLHKERCSRPTGKTSCVVDSTNGTVLPPGTRQKPINNARRDLFWWTTWSGPRLRHHQSICKGYDRRIGGPWLK